MDKRKHVHIHEHGLFCLSPGQLEIEAQHYQNSGSSITLHYFTSNNHITDVLNSLQQSMNLIHTHSAAHTHTQTHAHKHTHTYIRLWLVLTWK